jgi:protein-tyrosine phosphatase
MQTERYIPLQGATNFRDFGGYAAKGGHTVKWRRLFRSDRLSDLTADDYAALNGHGIRSVYDLRRDSETALAPTNWLGEAPPSLIRSPLFGDDAGLNTFQRIMADDAARHDGERARNVMVNMYVRMVTEPSPLAAFGRIFSRLGEADAFPALFHCAAGKDRTGVTCALLLGVLGVDRDDVTADFLLTSRYFDADGALKRRVGQVVADSEFGFWSEEALKPIFRVEPAYINAALDLVEAAGGTEAFLIEKAGVAPETLDHLRRELLD